MSFRTDDKEQIMKILQEVAAKKRDADNEYFKARDELLTAFRN
jgi:hypothetical protein